MLSVLLAPALYGASMSADEAFADGNRLFRDDLYWAALLRYRQAEEAGMNAPLLHYNTGIAHYRAGQYRRARSALLKATESPELEVLAHYNLGLNAYRAGSNGEALRWFRRARDQHRNPKVRRLAERAIAMLQRGLRDTDDRRHLADARREERPLLDVSYHARIGFGTDSNVYRTPDAPYIDLANPARPLITPAVTSGAYLPIDLGARASVNSLPSESFFGAYRLVGKYYQDKALDNANEFVHELRFGSEYLKRVEHRERRVYSAFTLAQHDESYFDPDDGSIRSVNGTAIEDRMNYVRYGPEITLRESYRKLSFGLSLKAQLWNYDDIEVVPEYDHEYFRIRGIAQYRLARTSLVRLSIATFSRRFGDRPSYDLDGLQRLGNPTVRYDYAEAAVTARQRITRGMWFGFSYTRTDRTDRHAGYNDYTRDSYGLEFRWNPGTRFDVAARGHYRIYDFPNAFAFNNPQAGRKTLDALMASVEANYRVTDALSLVFEAEHRGTESNDARIAFDRGQYSIGLRWRR